MVGTTLRKRKHPREPIILQCERGAKSKNIGWINTSCGVGTDGCVGTIIEPKFVNRDHIPDVYTTDDAKEKSRLQEEADRKYGSTFGSKQKGWFERIVLKIKNILKT